MEVRALIRRPPRPGEDGPGRPVEHVQGDVTDAEQLREIAHECSAIVHCVEFSPEHYAQHVAIAQPLVSAAVRAGARLVICTPSWAFGTGDRGWFTPNTVGQPGNRLSVIRCRAEAMVREISRVQGAGLSVLRLPRLYGPGCNTPFIMDCFHAGLAGEPIEWPGLLDARVDQLYVEDAAAAILAALANPSGEDAVHCIAPTPPMTAAEFCRTIADMTGQRSRVRARGGWRDLFRGGRRSSRSEEWEELAQTFQEEVLVDGSIVRDSLLFRPAVDVMENMRQTLFAIDRGDE